MLLKWTLPWYPAAVLPYASRAVTVTLPAAPAVRGEASPETERVVAAAGVTTMALWEPVIEGVTVSVAVTVRVPAVLRLTPRENVWTPASPTVKV